MDREANVKQGVLERMLFDASAEPTDLPVSLMKYITNDLSDDQQIGRGRVSAVYKRLLGNRIIAVKELNDTLGILENKFNEEVGCLMKPKHKSAVRLLGYCSDTRGIIVDYEGKFVMADVRQKLLCFEYLRNRSLDKYTIGAFCLLERRKCYETIKGICEGLYHQNVKRCIVLLDLKPANILLDDNMVPKIADFHLLSGYMAPEFFDGEIKLKTDIYSLGVIIRQRDIENGLIGNGTVVQ